MSPRDDRRQPRRGRPTYQTAAKMVDAAFGPEQQEPSGPDLPRERAEIPGAQLAALQGRWEELNQASRQISADAARLQREHQRLRGEWRKVATWRFGLWLWTAAVAFSGSLILWTLWRYQP
ncbi:MAG: hypothetical protein ACK47B_10760 [Armatimonadota bacterium]